MSDQTSKRKIIPKTHHSRVRARLKRRMPTEIIVSDENEKKSTTWQFMIPLFDVTEMRSLSRSTSCFGLAPSQPKASHL